MAFDVAMCLKSFKIQSWFPPLGFVYFGLVALTSSSSGVRVSIKACPFSLLCISMNKSQRQ